jgi:hypothetical protein
MKKVIVTLLSFLLIVNFSHAQAKKKGGKLDRKTYVCEFILTGKKKAEGDEVKFSGGTMVCKMMQDDGFKATAYESSVDSSSAPPVISFSMEAKDDKENTFKWEGKVTGDDIEGTAIITDKKGKVKKSYSFDGVIKGKKEPK